MSATEAILNADEIFFSYRDGGTVLNGLSLALGRESVMGIVGPNGVGKSTILKILSGYLRPQRGTVKIDDVPIGDMGALERARRLAVVPQNVYAPAPFTVREVIRMGRRARLSRFSLLSGHDQTVISRTLTEFGLAELAERPLGELSGGERQRVMIAAAVAQDPDIMLLDEPTSHLDIGNSARIVRALLRWQRARGAALLIVTHDVQMAARICDRVLLLNEGTAVVDGSPRLVLEQDILQRVYGHGVMVHEGTRDGMPVILPDFSPDEFSQATSTDKHKV